MPCRAMPCHATPRRYGTVFGVCGTAEAEAEAEVLEADGRLVIDAHGIVLGLTLVPARDGRSFAADPSQRHEWPMGEYSRR